MNHSFQKYSQTGAGIPFSAMRKKGKSKKSKKSKNKTRRTSVKRSRRRLKRKTKRMAKGKGKAKAKAKTKTCQCGSNTYTGQEDSPKGLGKCGECIPLNVMLKGKDGTLYENKKGGWIKV